jgi:hypothetical protein
MQNVNDAIDSDAPSPLAPTQTPADKERQQCDVNANTDIEARARLVLEQRTQTFATPQTSRPTPPSRQPPRDRSGAALT